MYIMYIYNIFCCGSCVCLQIGNIYICHILDTYICHILDKHI